MYLSQPLHKALREAPGRTAVVFGRRRWSYAEFVDRVSRLAGALKEQGLRPGDRVGMLAINSDRYLEFFYGTFWAGGAVNPVNIRWSPTEIAYSLDDCDTRILIVDDAFASLLPEVRRHSESLNTVIYAGEEATPASMLDYETLIQRADPVPDVVRQGDDLAGVFYTGGTTGLPKGVMLTHANIYLNALSTLTAVNRQHSTVGLHSAPLFHVAGLSLTGQLFARLGTHVVLPQFEPGMVLRAIEEEEISETFLVPTMLKRVLEHPDFRRRRLDSLRFVMYGAAPIDGKLLDRATEAFPQARFAQMYGMTELGAVATVLPPWSHTPEGRKAEKLRSAGLPIPCAEIRILGPGGEELPHGETGEIVVRGPCVMPAYWSKPEQTREVLDEGWMHTGDAGYMDADGFVFIVDRIKDMIVSGGENVYSAEVERAVLTLPQVSDCAVIGVPDDDLGERVHAVVVLKEHETLTLDALKAHCRRLIGGYKCPRSMEVRSELPLSAAGKILKYKLREDHVRHARA
ncbi:MAG: long-chain fatty acid--CoA ligase [Ectothiorhodospiraceae bacterium]|nr:long-chain fatty acid--CoA ligase [Ectothiorhodospiraceae bacterium]